GSGDGRAGGALSPRSRPCREHGKRLHRGVPTDRSQSRSVHRIPLWTVAWIPPHSSVRIRRRRHPPKGWARPSFEVLSRLVGRGPCPYRGLGGATASNASPRLNAPDQSALPTTAPSHPRSRSARRSSSEAIPPAASTG